MGREKLDQMVEDIRIARERTLKELTDLDESELLLPTAGKRWAEVRRVLLRFGDHMREHTNHIEGIRAEIERSPTMTERILGTVIGFDR